ncbi:MAG TPA: UvrD-helicase domain-containing protein [Edaphocola sp.]|nr:UvrD-helicase domain-containing protein [Edaphocola sp.]
MNNALAENSERFNVSEVKLTGKNLVEASAGTGKTYSIAIIVLRVLIEQNVPVEQQLVVTYTNLAVAELQERIRKFIKEAYDIVNRLEAGISNGLEKKEDATIRLICERAFEKEQNFPPGNIQLKLKNKLRQALLTMDEASVLTIHGFCQRVLNEFAFESKQNFQAQLQTDVSEFIEQTINEFWRTELSNLPVGLFNLTELNQIRTNVRIIIKNALGDISFENSIEQEDVSDNKTIIEDYSNQRIEKKQELLDYLANNKEELKEDINKGGVSALKSYGNLLEHPEAFLNKFFKHGLDKGEDRAKYHYKFTSIFWNLAEEYYNWEEKYNEFKDKLKSGLYKKAFQSYFPKLKTKLEQANVLTFDALIQNLYKIVVTDKNERLIQLVRNKYPVVLIDEFQDTDVTQFKLFDELFVKAEQTLLFLIGDPKQSIYAFRNADVDSYLKAAENVDHKYSMNTNYRSGARMIQAVEHFFTSSGSQAFGYETDNGIQYEIVGASASNQEKYISRNGEIMDSLLFCMENKKDNAFEAIGSVIAELINPNNNYYLNDAGNQRPVLPKDITILVNDNKAIPLLKKELQMYNIPSVGMRIQKVLNTSEAKDISLILRAIIEPNIQNIKSAFFLSFLHNIYVMQNKDSLMPLEKLDDLMMSELFKSYNEIAENYTVFQALQKLFNDFSLQQLFANDVKGQYLMSNLLQISEILHQQQSRNGYTPVETWLWLKKQINDEADESDEYNQRIESDEEAVSIMTLHKSKGLEFPIVFIWGISNKGTIGKKYDLITVKNQHGDKVLKWTKSLSEEEKTEYINADNKEIRRKIYVGLTRPVYQCYVFYSKRDFTDTPLYSLLEKMSDGNEVNKAFEWSQEDEHVNFKYQPKFESLLSPILLNEDEHQKFKNSKTNWNIYSYSALSLHNKSIQRELSNSLMDYDHFIFNALPRGAHLGTKLHELLEHINFNKDYLQSNDWTYGERLMLSRFNFDKEDYSLNIAELLHHVLNAIISVGNDKHFQLKDLNTYRTKHELEFYFPLSITNASQMINELLQSYQIKISNNYQTLEGLMKGFVDLLFEHNGKYYILDWKSNYLGFNIEDYEGENLTDAMIQNQYHLQYLIYTVAVKKFLTQSLGESFNYEDDFGGVIYVFLRGVRANRNAGIFTNKPPRALIESFERLLDPRIVEAEN